MPFPRRRLVPVEHQDGRGDAGAIEEVRCQSDHRLEEVLLQQPLANPPLRGAAEEHAVGHHDAEAAGTVQHRHHVLDEGQVALGLRRDPEAEAPVAVVLRHVPSPFVEAERADWQSLGRTAAALLHSRASGPESCPPFSIRASGSPWRSVFILQMAQVPRFFSWPWSVRLHGLPPLRSMWWAHSMSMPPEPAVGSQMRIPSDRSKELDDELDDHPRGVELAALLAGVVGELLYEVLVGAAEQIGFRHAVVAEGDLGEVLDQPREHGVAVSGVPELALVVVVDAGENAFQRWVLFLERCTCLVQRLADVRGPLPGWCSHRARSGTKNRCSSGSDHATPSRTPLPR